MYLECNICGWQGYPEELISQTKDLDDTDFSYCPFCGSNDLEIDDEDNEIAKTFLIKGR